MQQAIANPIIFDLDGTLADTLPLIYLAFNLAIEPAIGRKLTTEEIRQRFGPPDHEIIRALVPEAEFRVAVDRYLAVYEAQHDALVSTFPGIHDLIQTARDQQVKIGVVTGKSRRTAIVTLRKTGLLPLVDVLYGGDDVSRQKPDPEAVSAALKDLNTPTNHTGVMVGDSAADMLAGRAARLRTIGVTWGSPDHHELHAAHPDQLCDDARALGLALGLRQADVVVKKKCWDRNIDVR